MIEFLIGTILGATLAFSFCAVLATAKMADRDEHKRNQ